MNDCKLLIFLLFKSVCFGFRFSNSNSEPCARVFISLISNSVCIFANVAAEFSA